MLRLGPWAGHLVSFLSLSRPDRQVPLLPGEAPTLQAPMTCPTRSHSSSLGSDPRGHARVPGGGGEGCPMRLQSPPTESVHFSTWAAPCWSGNVYLALCVIQRDAERRGRRRGNSGPQSHPAPEVERPCRETQLPPNPPPPPAYRRPAREVPLWESRQVGGASCQRQQTRQGSGSPEQLGAALRLVSCQLSQLSLRKQARSRRWALHAHHLPPSQQPGHAPGGGSHFPGGETKAQRGPETGISVIFWVRHA